MSDDKLRKPTLEEAEEVAKILADSPEVLAAFVGADGIREGLKTERRNKLEAVQPSPSPCSECEGSGVIEDDATGAMGYVVQKTCPSCNGKTVAAQGVEVDGVVYEADSGIAVMFSRLMKAEAEVARLRMGQGSPLPQDIDWDEAAAALLVRLGLAAYRTGTTIRFLAHELRALREMPSLPEIYVRRTEQERPQKLGQATLPSKEWLESTEHLHNCIGYTENQECCLERWVEKHHTEQEKSDHRALLWVLEIAEEYSSARPCEHCRRISACIREHI